MPYGITDYGLDIPTFEEWVEEYNSLYRNKFGLSENVSKSTFIAEVLNISALQDIKVWQSLLAVYNSKTLNGAEDIYLDELLSARGVFRLAAQKSSGVAIAEMAPNIPWDLIFPNTLRFSTLTGTIYKTTSPVTLKSRIHAYKLSKSEIISNPTITFTARNSTDPSSSVFTFDTTNPTVMDDIRDFLFFSAFKFDSDRVFVNSDILYIGFDPSDLTKPIGVRSYGEIFADRNVGIKWAGIPVEAENAGFSPLNVSEIVSVTPSSIIYNSQVYTISGVTNFDAFNSGNDRESDTAYLLRFYDQVGRGLSSTRPAITSALSSIDGVTKVKLYDNPTASNTTEADAFTIHAIVAGGASGDIANTLYNKIPVNVGTTGNEVVSVTTEDGSPLIIKYSLPTPKEVSVRVTYKTTDGNTLSNLEATNIKNQIKTLINTLPIGGTIYHPQLESVVYRQLSFNRLLVLTVEHKLRSEPDTSYVLGDRSAAFNEEFLIEDSDITFVKQV